MAAIKNVVFPNGWSGKSGSNGEASSSAVLSGSKEERSRSLVGYDDYLYPNGWKGFYASCGASGQWCPPICCCGDLTEEICLKEAKLFLEWKREQEPDSSEFAKEINSSSDFKEQPQTLLFEFRHKKWYFIHMLTGNYNDYERLCVRRRPSLYGSDFFSIYHMIGSSLESDMEYHKFLLKVFQAIEWKDTEKEGLEKAKEIRAASMPFINENLLSVCVEECLSWHHFRKLVDERRKLICLLYFRVILKKQEFQQVLHEIYSNKSMSFPFALKLEDNVTYSEGLIKSFLKKFCNYVDSQIPKVEAKDKYELLASQFMDKIKTKACPSKYVEYVTEKVNMAIELGILIKEDVLPDLIKREKMLSLIHY